MDQYLKEIAKELKLIRKEIQLENDLLMQEMGMAEQSKPAHRPKIQDQLNQMFMRD